MKNRIAFKIKTGYYLDLLTPETIKLLGSTKNKIKDENGENVYHLEITEVVSIHWNNVNNDYWQDSRFLHAFAPNKSFVQLLHVLPKVFIFLKSFNLEFPCIEVWFTNQNSKQLEIDDKINVTLVTT